MDARGIAAALALLGGLAGVPASLWWATTERVTKDAAAVVRAVATPDDLVIIDASLAPREDLGGLMRPFGDLATLVLREEDPRPALATFPQERVFLVGEGLDAASLGAVDGVPLGAGVVQARVPHDGELIVQRMNELKVSVAKDGAARACAPPHPSGGVRCGKENWQYVGPVVVTAGGRFVSCLWVHPLSGHTMHVDVPLRGEQAAALWLQYTDDVRGEARAPIHVVAQADGAALGEAACTSAGEGRCPVDVRLPDGAKTLRLSLATSDSGRQLVCLGGTLRR